MIAGEITIAGIVELGVGNAANRVHLYPRRLPFQRQFEGTVERHADLLDSRGSQTAVTQFSKPLGHIGRLDLVQALAAPTRGDVNACRCPLILGQFLTG